MSKLATAIQNNALTENGAEAFESSLSATLDLFFKIGASRGHDLSKQFLAAFKEDRDVALRILLWARDVRGGAGEREQYRNLLKSVIQRDPEVALRLMRVTPEVGRWDDLKVFFGTPLENEAAELWVSAITEGNGLAAKWAPRKDRKGARPLRRAFGGTEAEWRRFVVRNTEVVEQKMCANEWNSIDFEKVPSLASARYQRAFERHAVETYREFADKLESGEATINAEAVYPYDIVKSLETGNRKVADAQWKALPNYLENSNERFLPIVDTSGSMWVPVSGSTRAIDVAVSLGMYLAERNNSVFRDEFITFSKSPRLQTIKGDTLMNRVKSVEQSDWGFNTNLEASFDLILNTAVNHNLPEEDMPTKVLVISDMQFDRFSVQGAALRAVRTKFANKGYKAPQLVWWNVADRGGNIPMTVNDDGAALVSGFSPSIMKSLLNGSLNPVSVMLDTVMVDRYNY